MNNALDRQLQRWVSAGLLSEEVAQNIVAWEKTRHPAGRWRWPVWVAVALGSVALGAGVLLFVASHWDDIGTPARLSLVLALTAVFHAAGVWVRPRSTIFALAFHALGTIAFGAGIFLVGQIFYLEEHWPGAFLLWAAGAWAGWWLLREWPQLLLAAVLTPIWLAGEWLVRCEEHRWGVGLFPVILILALAVVFFTAFRPGAGGAQRALFSLGAVLIVPAAVFVGAIGLHDRHLLPPAPAAWQLLAWCLALLPPLAVACVVDRRRWTRHVAGLVWVGCLAALSQAKWELGIYAWCALGAAGLIAWGLEESRVAYINFGVAGFALTVVYFYFSQVMDRLDRSLSLIVLGVLLLGGGWFLERWRKNLLRRLEVGQ